MDPRIPANVRPLLQQYVYLLTPELPNIIYGVYLYGSIALANFDDKKSDIDFITLTKRKLTHSETKCLKNIHDKLRNLTPYARKMDGMYIAIENIGKSNQELLPYPYYTSGRFRSSGYWDINSVTWWTLKHNGITLAGSDISKQILTVNWIDVLNTMKYNLHEYWAKKTKSNLIFLFDGWVEDAILTVSRILYTLEHKKIGAKLYAAECTLQAIPPQWHVILEEALRIRQGKQEPSLFSSRWKRARETKEFISYITELCNEKYFNVIN